MVKKQIHCPKCNTPTTRWIRYAYSSWLFPVRCGSCGGKYFLGYSPWMFLLLWGFISPVYLACLLFLTVTMVPTGVILPVFLVLGAFSMILLVFLGKPTERLDLAGRRDPGNR